MFPHALFLPAHAWAPRTCNQICIPSFHPVKFLEAPRRPAPLKVVGLQDQISIDKNGGDIYGKQKSAIGVRYVGHSVAGKQERITIVSYFLCAKSMLCHGARIDIHAQKNKNTLFHRYNTSQCDSSCFTAKYTHQELQNKRIPKFPQHPKPLY